MGTKNNPGKFDCYANAKPDEPMFVLLARDSKSPAVLSMWCNLYSQEKGGTDNMTDEQFKKFHEAVDCAMSMAKWKRENPDV